MTEVWDQARIQLYIDHGVEESLNLDYKAAGAISKNKTAAITKLVSSFANSDGGRVIYGISEDKDNRHLPGELDPISRAEFSKEWLEHVIGNIRPKIDGLLIYPVTIGNCNTDVVYVVDIPKSYTAHQAMDKRYYKRFNFESVMMDDYEIRDVMNRLRLPRIDVDLKIEAKRRPGPTDGESFRLELTLTNSGSVYAQYVRVKVKVPTLMALVGKSDNEVRRLVASMRGEIREVWRDNRVTVREANLTSHGHEPLLPCLQMKPEPIQLADQLLQIPTIRPLEINWTAFADNSPPRYGIAAIKDIPIVYEDGRKLYIRDWTN